MSTAPQYLVLDMGPNMVELCETIDHFKLENLNKDTVLDQIVESVFFIPEVGNEILDLTDSVTSADFLYTETGESDPGAAVVVAKQIMAVAIQIGEAAYELSRDLTRRRLVENDYFNYKFHRNVHDQTLVFSRFER